ncbi:MAG: GNAT family protein [Candidatus Promineifilaceae bacterium]|nr:GNAT family protein [Candidatus Promineifilaceae bacterium]
MTIRFPAEIPVLETGHLRLRELQPGDAADVFHLYADPEVVRFYDLDLFTTKEQARELIQRQARRFASQEAMRWAITQQLDGRVIGTVGYVFDGPNDAAGLGYDLSSSYWRRGITSAAVRLVINYGFRSLRLHRIQALVMPANTPSAALLRKLGFQEEGLLRQSVLIKGRYHDMRCFSLLSHEWPGLE